VQIKPLLIICDVNVLISVAMAKGSTVNLLRESWKHGTTQLMLCEELLDEFNEVMRRPRLQKYVAHIDIGEQVEDFKAHGEMIAVYPPYPESPDPKDDYLLAMLRDSEAICLITSDKAILELGEYQGKPILTMAGFLLSRGWL
jgi:putative PIN family toxin of toxin-antitoxin system